MIKFNISNSLGMGLSITLKAAVKLPGWLWGAVDQWSEHLQLRQEAQGTLDSWWLPWVFSLPAGLLMLMGWRICGALVQFSCYQHWYEWKDLWCSIVQFGCYQHRHKWISSSPIYIRLSLEVTCMQAKLKLISPCNALTRSQSWMWYIIINV